MNSARKHYQSIDDLPASIPVFPLTRALLLPRGQIPLNIFEPRYLAMVDAALAGSRMIGLVQPAYSTKCNSINGLCHIGCAGRLVAFNETPDERYIISLVGVSRFMISAERDVTTPFRQIELDWRPFLSDLEPDRTTSMVDRPALLQTLQSYLDANNMETDWTSIEEADTEMLVNALAMMSPYGAAEKQAFLEAPDLKTRADTLIAVTEMSLARQDKDSDVVLQ